MSDLDKDKVLEDFTKAYTAANGKAPEIEVKGGWYSVDGGKNMRLAQLAEMSATLGGAKKSSGSDAPKKKAADKPKKTSTKKAANKSSETFSVKDFYKQQILDRNPGAILPR